VDKDSDLVHTLKVTAANVRDVAMTPEWFTGQDETVYGVSGYLGAEKRKGTVVLNSIRKKSNIELIDL